MINKITITLLSLLIVASIVEVISPSHTIYLVHRLFDDNTVIERQKGVSPARAEEIYNDLLKYVGMPADMMPRFRVLPISDVRNAFTNFDLWEISITTGMLNEFEDDSEAAAILSHEIGHALIRDNVINPKNDPYIQTILEGNADKYSTYFMLRAGYDVCKGAYSYWSRVREQEGDYLVYSSHPNHSYRIWQLDFPQCRSR